MSCILCSFYSNIYTSLFHDTYRRCITSEFAEKNDRKSVTQCHHCPGYGDMFLFLSPNPPRSSPPIKRKKLSKYRQTVSGTSVNRVFFCRLWRLTWSNNFSLWNRLIFILMPSSTSREAALISLRLKDIFIYINKWVVPSSTIVVSMVCKVTAWLFLRLSYHLCIMCMIWQSQTNCFLSL